MSDDALLMPLCVAAQALLFAGAFLVVGGVARPPPKTGARLAAAWCASTAAVTSLQGAFAAVYIVYVPLFDRGGLGLGFLGALVSAPFLAGLVVLGWFMCRALMRVALALVDRGGDRDAAARAASAWLLCAALPMQLVWSGIVSALSPYCERVVVWAVTFALTVVLSSIVLGALLRRGAATK